MGICLDIDRNNGSKVFDEADARSTGRWQGEAGLLATPPHGSFPMQNVGPVKFEVPTVPVIFILGGPGSGKVTHCDTLMAERKGVIHINMTDLLQQYVIGNNMEDFGSLSSKTVTEVLMLEMKMSPEAKTFLVSGYPRNMRDIVEYSEKIQIVNGVILISWKQEVLERQIDFGAKLGHIVLGLARMELKNFYRSVMPVAEYFDQNGMLMEIDGERDPNEVYIDFRDAVLRILGMSSDEDNQNPRAMQAEVEVERTDDDPYEPTAPSEEQNELDPNETPASPVLPIIKPAKTANHQRKGLPAFIWVIGGPGSNKATLCNQALRNMPGWVHVSVGDILRSMTSTNVTIHDAIIAGEMVPQDIVMQLVEQQVLLNRDTDGIILSGFPRNFSQVDEFENKFGQAPPLVLLDCSKLQFGRGRLDGTIPAFRRRLALFREMTLPMLKKIDNNKRLTMIDGDTDVENVQLEFANALYQLMKWVRRKEENSADGNNQDQDSGVQNSEHPNSMAPGNINGGQTIESYQNGIQRIPNGIVKQIENQLNGGSSIAKGVLIDEPILQNGLLKKNGIVKGLQNGGVHLSNGFMPGKNKVAPLNGNNANNGRDPVRSMFNEVDD
ncbi:adenylate kinase isoenzyme 5 [Leptopilina boulardi]|uniref:adenylate kinase isoenzyme 5 n=1 Tax=Leptopilina boulardi TaxID=63433 RepID=UPI0021F5FB8B|nr:adenylate kinase isoenzyme 5 [Leptopilina boulardi]